MRLFARHDGRHARPRGRFLTWLLGEETGTVLAVPADVRGAEPDERGYVSRLWAEDWGSPEDSVYDEPPGHPAWTCHFCGTRNDGYWCRGCTGRQRDRATTVMPAVKVGGAWLPLAGDRVSGTLDDSGIMPAVRVCAGRSVRTIWQPPQNVPRRGTASNQPYQGANMGAAAPGGFQTAWDRYRATGLTGLAWVDGILTAPRCALEAAVT